MNSKGGNGERVEATECTAEDFGSLRLIWSLDSANRLNWWYELMLAEKHEADQALLELNEKISRALPQRNKTSPPTKEKDKRCKETCFDIFTRFSTSVSTEEKCTRWIKETCFIITWLV